MVDSVHPVDERLPLAELIPLGIQHVLVMYAGAVAVPLIIGRALKLPPEQIAILVNADLFAAALSRSYSPSGIGPFGIRLPVMMGVTFASVSPMLAMANNPELGLAVIFGSVIAAGIFGLIVAPFMSSLLRFFPPVVTGTIIAVIGISLMRIGINWAAGAAAPTLPGYGDPINLAIAAFVLVVILAHRQIRAGFPREYCGFDRHHSGIHSCLGHRKGQFFGSQQCRMARYRLSLPACTTEV